MVQLSAQEHSLWQRLSVFAGSFTRDAVRAVVIGDQLPSTDADHLLDALVANGYVAVEQSDVGLRYALPEPLRATARAQLPTHVADTVYERLLTFYTAFAEEVEAHAFGSERAVWMRRLGAEHDNLAAILTWLVARGNAEGGLHFAFTLSELWFENSHTSEGRAWFATLHALPQAAPRTVLRAQALDLAGAYALNQEEYATARALKEEGVAILRELGNHERLAYALLHLGHLAGFGQGDLLAAQGLYQEALDIFRALANAEGTAHALSNLGAVALLRGAYATAKSLILESLHLYQALGFAYDVATSFGKMAGIAAGFNQPQRAMRLAGAFAAQCASIGVSQAKAFYERNEQFIAPARRALPEAEQQTLWAEGQTMTLEQAVAYALDEPSDVSTHSFHRRPG